MGKLTKPLVLVISIAVALPAALVAQKAEPSPGFASAQLEHLDLVVGIWKVEQKRLDPAASIVAVAEGTEEITWILDKHAIQRVYRTKTGSSAYEAIGLLTWSDAAKRFEGVWLDDASTAGATHVTGQWNEKDRTFVFELDGPDGKGGRQKYKTIDRFESDSTRRAMTYAVNGSEVVKINEVTYTRTTPCPDKLRAIWDK